MKEVFTNRLNLQENYKEKSPEKLPVPTLADEDISIIEIDQDLKRIKESLRQKKFIEGQNSKDYEKNFKDHYSEAAIFRILRNKGNEKLYAGFDEYASLSSGRNRTGSFRFFAIFFIPPCVKEFNRL